MPIADLDRVYVYYEDTGGDGAAIVFSHGLLMDRDMFEPQVGALRSEFRCVSWDQRGHGDTRAEGAFTYWDSAGDLIGLLDHLDIDHAFLAGMSQGGYVSLRAALVAPERMRGLCLIDTQAGVEDPLKMPMYEAMAERWAGDGPTGDLAELAASIIVAPADTQPWIAKWMARSSASVTEPFRALAERDDLHDRLGEIACPAIVIHGEADIAIEMDRAERLCSGLPRCDGLVRIAGGGHASNLSHPGIVTEALRDFCRRHSG